MAGSQGRANALIAKANNKLRGWSMFGSYSKYEDAAELLASAAKHLNSRKHLYWPMAEVWMRGRVVVGQCAVGNVPFSCSGAFVLIWLRPCCVRLSCAWWWLSRTTVCVVGRVL
ncbi:unnamed protein product [Ostreobium quekettii]|uniref:Uncharacterized protein n=1 Tax=Ostreobium quekettii TaxID=121088 RepID=A0A8S1J7F7_9CHLO|nr:unnamed protein product [Ostreobium quekettii]|eukprot:evm.model.scf_1461EXC.4 EVM.evm.TU.scf_1461EXC.4   scf_1461EXC:22280-22621(-)